ncbi:hypothetical protein HYV86_01280 [Candidatus Woesearchaeota archaeon]|nr:hypothetical protein [Candidatus Woesearchaeota archaeon]
MALSVSELMVTSLFFITEVILVYVVGFVLAYRIFKRLFSLSRFISLLLGFISILVYWVVYFIIKSKVVDLVSIWLLRELIGLMIPIVCIIFAVKLIRDEKEKERKEFEELQKSKGLIRFIDRFRNDRWGTPEQVKKWQREDEEAKEKEKVINQVIHEIEVFKPLKDYGKEELYQHTLAIHLRSFFPGIEIEKQIGSSRPDIVVGDVAIEVKGPTSHQDLDSIASKCMRYKEHFGEIVIVLFDVQVNGRYYDEWLGALNKNFPNVKVIRK